MYSEIHLKNEGDRIIVKTHVGEFILALVGGELVVHGNIKLPNEMVYAAMGANTLRLVTNVPQDQQKSWWGG